MGTLYFFFSILLAINEGDIFSFILHCESHSITLYAISTLLATAANQPLTTSANHPLTCESQAVTRYAISTLLATAANLPITTSANHLLTCQLTCCAVISGWQQSTS